MKIQMNKLYVSFLLLVVFCCSNMAHSRPDASLVINENTGEILYAENAHKEMYPASLTKMMTIYLAFNAIKKGIKKGKIKKISQAHLTLGQAYFELKNFDEAKKQFRVAARDEDKKVKKTANNWIKYTENEEKRMQSLQLRRDYIKKS